MTDRHDLALRLALVKVLAERLSDAKAAAGCEITDTWRPKDRATAVLPGDREIGTVTLTSGRTTSRVADEAAYEAWVKEAHPDEFETVTITRVRPEFTQRILSAARKLGVAVDAETGEEVPGVDVATGDPFPMVKLNDAAAELVAQAWRDGSLAELVGALLPAIEGGEGS